MKEMAIKSFGLRQSYKLGLTVLQISIRNPCFLLRFKTLLLGPVGKFKLIIATTEMQYIGVNQFVAVQGNE